MHALFNVTSAFASRTAGTDESIHVTEDALPWEWIIAGVPVLLFVALVALALHRVRKEHR